MSAVKYWLWLSALEGLRNQSRLALLEHFGTPENIYYADPGELLHVEGLPAGQRALLENRNLSAADHIFGECERLGLRILTMQDADYPARLLNIYDPPVLLYLKGRLPAVDEEVTVALVGTRRATPYGVRAAEELGYGLAKQGAVVVSGIAEGIDAAAIRGALRAGGRVLSVLGGGIDRVYPASSEYLFSDVPQSGCLISEYPPRTEPKGEHFPVRNRILAGLSLAVAVVEAPLDRSGALNTAHTALEQGRDVFAVPGGIDAPMSRGCNQLIREGAGLVTDAWDLLREYQAVYPEKLAPAAYEVPETLGYQARQRAAAAPRETEKRPPAGRRVITPAEESLTDDQIAVLRALGGETAQVDEVIEETGLSARRVLSALTVLTMQELVAEESGKRFRALAALSE